MKFERKSGFRVAADGNMQVMQLADATQIHFFLVFLRLVEIGQFYSIPLPPKQTNIDLCTGVYLRSECRGLFDHDRSLA